MNTMTLNANAGVIDLTLLFLYNAFTVFVRKCIDYVTYADGRLANGSDVKLGDGSVFYNFLALLESTVIVGKDLAKEAAETGGAEAADAAMGYGSTGFLTLGIYALVIGALWFFMLRPQRKRDKQMKEMQEGIRSGDNIITSSGLYGKVISVGEDCFIIEFGMNRGIRIPVRKSDVIGIKSPKIGAPIPQESIESK